MSVDLESARREWEEGYRRFERATRDEAQAERLLAQFDIVSAELRRRVGGTFTLRELSGAYADLGGMAPGGDRGAGPCAGWARTVSMVGDAAFHTYARGAVDYAP